MSNTFVSHLECSMTGKRYEVGKVHGLSEDGRPLLVRYDLEKIAENFTKSDLMQSQVAGFWRYAPMLPVEDKSNRISLGEVVTPLIALNQSSSAMGSNPGNIIVKDEGRLPTGSFKARGLCLAVSMAKQLGLNHLAIPTNGNAGAAMAAYASRAGMKTTVLCPEDTPDVNIREIALQGGDTYLVNGLINDCGKIVGEGKSKVGWFDISTLKEPYRIEGKKTMGLELAEQMDWQLPDAIFYPTGGGTGLIGMWKAFHELQQMGWIGDKLPKMIAVQAETCAPIVKAWEKGDEHAPLWENATTIAAGIRVPIAVGDFLIIRAVRESDGFCMAVNDEDILRIRDQIAQQEGLLMSPEGAATAVACQNALAQGLINAEDKVVLFNCATGLKYPMPQAHKLLDRHKLIDYSQFGGH